MQATQKKRDRKPLATAVAHPIRVKCLVVLTEREASPAEIAREVGIEVSKVGYHVTALAEADLIELVRTAQVRGAVEHFYKAVQPPVLKADEEVGMSTAERRRFAENVVGIYSANFMHALDTRTLLERPDHHLTRVSVNVDEEGWGELAEAYMELYDRVYEIREAAATRMAESDEAPIRALSFQSLFEIPRTAKGD